MTSDLQLAAEYAAKAVSEQRRNLNDQRGGGSEVRGESAGGDSPKVRIQTHQDEKISHNIDVIFVALSIQC